MSGVMNGQHKHPMVGLDNEPLGSKFDSYNTSKQQ